MTGKSQTLAAEADGIFTHVETTSRLASDPVLQPASRDTTRSARGSTMVGAPLQAPSARLAARKELLHMIPN